MDTPNLGQAPAPATDTRRQPRARTPGRRSYDDGCAAAHALDLVGERWALLVVRELLLGPRRFSDLRQNLAGISPNVLTQRLTDLEAAGVVRRHTLQPPAASRVYALTPWGQQLEAVILELLRWGVRSPGFERGRALTADAMALSFKVMLDAGRAKALSCRITLVMHQHAYHLALAQGRLAVARGAPPCHPAEAGAWASATLQAEPVTVLQMAYGKRPLGQVLAAGEAHLQGDAAALRRFFSCFEVAAPLPSAGKQAGSVAMMRPFS